MNQKQNRIVFGYKRNAYGEIVKYTQQAEVVKLIFFLYLTGNSLSSIAKDLEEIYHYSSPSNKPKWSSQTIINILSNEAYKGNSTYPAIIESNIFQEAAQLRAERSNMDVDHHRKTSRFNSADALSGKIFCGECGRNYRRITKSNKEIVWRCANRVEHGSKICKHSVSLDDEILKDCILSVLSERNVTFRFYHDALVLENIDAIKILPDRQIEFTFKQ